MISSVTLFTFISITLLVLSVGMLAYDWKLRYRFEVQERLQALQTENDESSISLFKDIARLRSQVEEERQTWSEWFCQLIEQADLKCTIRQFVVWCGMCGLAAAVVGYLPHEWGALVAMPFGVMVPFLVLFLRRHIRSRKLSRQLPEVFQMISRAVRSGQTLQSALRIIAEDFQPPVSEEFALCYEQQNLGMSRESAFRKLSSRTGIMELQIFVVALLVQAKSGGDLVGLLDNLAAMIQKRLRLKDRVRALTGEGRMQALVLLVLPIVALVGIAVLAPEYARTLLDRPQLLVGTAFAQAVGALWVRRIVNFEY